MLAWLRTSRTFRVVGAGAEVEVGHGHQQVRAGVVVRGDDASGLEFEFGDADAVLDEEDFFGAAVEDFQAAVLRPI